MSSTSQSRLKRRIHGSSAVSSPQSRPGTTFSSDDFDLPPPETHPEPPKKRARKKGLPAASKKKQPQGEGDDKDAITTHDTQPRVSSIKELPIPTVNEMALRKPSIVHFGPGGPENQAVLPSLKKPVGVLEDARADDDIPAASPSMNNTASMPPPAAKAFPDGPVRVKKSLLDAISTEPTEPEHPPATPASFCTRLEAENISIPGIQTTPDQAREPSIHDTTYASGNASITLIDDDSTFPRQQTFSPSRRRRQQRSISTDLRSTEDSPSFRRRSKVMVDNHKLPSPGIRESQQGLMDSMSQITKDVMFRFGEEEDAIKARVEEFQVGGNAVLNTLTESWNDRLSHHYGKLRKDLEEEKAVLAKATETLNAAKASQLDTLRNSDAMLQKIDERTDTLLARIAALSCRE